MQPQHFSKNRELQKANFQKNDKTMKFCKKCRKRIVEEFNDAGNYVFGSGKVCQCNIHVVGNGSKIVVQRKTGFMQYEVID